MARWVSYYCGQCMLVIVPYLYQYRWDSNLILISERLTVHYIASSHTYISVKKKDAFSDLHFEEFERIIFVSYKSSQLCFKIFNQNDDRDIVIIFASSVSFIFPSFPHNKYCCREGRKPFNHELIIKICLKEYVFLQ